MMTADTRRCQGVSVYSRLSFDFRNETAKQLWLHEPRQRARTSRGEAFNVDATYAALLERQRPAGANQMSGQLAKGRLVTYERDATSTGVTRELRHH